MKAYSSRIDLANERMGLSERPQPLVEPIAIAVEQRSAKAVDEAVTVSNCLILKDVLEHRLVMFSQFLLRQDQQPRQLERRRQRRTVSVMGSEVAATSGPSPASSRRACSHLVTVPLLPLYP